MKVGARRNPRLGRAVRSRIGVLACVAVACCVPGACSTYSGQLLVTGGGGDGAGGGGGSAGFGVGAIAGGAGDSSAQAGSFVAGGSAGQGGSELGAAGAAPNDEAGAGGVAGSSEVAATGGGGGLSANAGNGGLSGGGGTAGGAITSGGGGTTGGASAGGTGGGSDIEMIADFETGYKVMLPINRRNGPWYPTNDGTAAGTQTFNIVSLTGADARAGSSSTMALRMTASGFTVWGSGAGGDFVNQNAVKVAYDVSAYKGIRFYAKVGAGAQTAMNLQIPTTYSDPMGGKCSDSVANKHCYDHLYCPFISATALKTTWAVYECDFTQLIQQGNSGGLPQASLDPASVYGLAFTFNTMKTDVWIDDVAFVLK